MNYDLPASKKPKAPGAEQKQTRQKATHARRKRVLTLCSGGDVWQMDFGEMARSDVEGRAR